MKHIIVILFIILPTISFAQGPRPGDEKMESYKVTWLTTKLDLSADQAKIFWPIYNDYTREHTALRKERAQKMISFRKVKEIDDLTDAEIEKLILNDFAFKQRDLSIEKKYYTRFKADLPIKIVGKFFRAQEAFKKELLNRFKGGQAKQ